MNACTTVIGTHVLKKGMRWVLLLVKRIMINDNIYTCIAQASTLTCVIIHCCVCMYALAPLCVLLRCCDRPDLEKHWDRELRLCVVTEGGGIQTLALSFTEPGGSLTLSVAPSPSLPPSHPPTNRSGAVERCCSRMRIGINQKFTVPRWETIFE